MEQATDALKMAFAVFVFVIALSVSVNAFSEAKRTTDVLIENSDREIEYINLENAQEGSAYYNAEVDASGNIKNTIRTVNIESIIPTIYRAYKENYKIVFAGSYFQPNNWLYKKIDTDDPTNSEGIPVYSIDLKNISIAYGNQEEFLNGIVFGKFFKNGELIDLKNNTGDLSMLGGVNSNKTPIEYFKSTYQIKELRSDKKTLYDMLKECETSGKSIQEHLGTYYQDDEGGATQDTPEVNKTKKRVITYVVNN